MTEENQIKKQKKNNFKVALGTITIIGGLGLGFYGLINEGKSNNFTRIVNEEGNYDLDGAINYYNLNTYQVIEFKTITGETKKYIADAKGRVNELIYYDIYSGTQLIAQDDNNLISSTNIREFLIAYDMIKAKYSKDDIDYLLNRIKDDYQNNKNLKLVKTKSE